MALGASHASIMRSIVLDGLWLVMGGLVVGSALAVLVSRMLQESLFGVTATDPTTFGAVAAILVIVALLACVIPARRALRASIRWSQCERTRGRDRTEERVARDD